MGVLENDNYKVCGEEPCWQAEGIGTNGRCVYSGCLLPRTWRCRRDREEPYKSQGGCRPVTVVMPDGRRKEFPSRMAAADYLGCDPSTISQYRGCAIIPKGKLAGVRIL